MERTEKGIAIFLGAALLAVVIGQFLVDTSGPTTGEGQVVAHVDERPNVLILLWDTTRADRLSIYNPTLETTPRMKAWADQSVVFENAISPAMWTVPSHASMFTGLPPQSHGAGYDWRWLDHHNNTLAEHLKENGYETYAFSANPNLSPHRVNLLQGFDRIELSWGPRWKKAVVANGRKKMLKKDASTEISPGYKKGALTNKPFTYNAGPITHDAFTGWLKRRKGDGPWMAYLSYMEAHKPRIPSLDARRRLVDDDEIRVQLKTDISFRNQLAYSYGKLDYTEEELAAIRSAYDATLVDLDETTMDMLEEMDAMGELENTIVIFTSDHGEMLGEHQLFGHRASVYHALVHVPLVVSWPKGLKPQRVTRPVSNMDIYNTVVELTGVPKPDQPMSEGNLIEGTGGTWGQFTQTISIDRLGWAKISKMFPDVERDPWRRTYTALVDGDYKLIESSDGGIELYDVAKDHAEDHDLSEADPSRVAALQKQLAEVLAAMPSYDPDKRTSEDQVTEDSDAMKKQLEMLGYLDEEDLEGGE